MSRHGGQGAGGHVESIGACSRAQSRSALGSPPTPINEAARRDEASAAAMGAPARPVNVNAVPTRTRQPQRLGLTREAGGDTADRPDWSSRCANDGYQPDLPDVRSVVVQMPVTLPAWTSQHRAGSGDTASCCARAAAHDAAPSGGRDRCDVHVECARGDRADFGASSVLRRDHASARSHEADGTHHQHCRQQQLLQPNAEGRERQPGERRQRSQQIHVP
eukprot:29829-Pleurochrysis_carterae.AAC.1